MLCTVVALVAVVVALIAVAAVAATLDGLIFSTDERAGKVDGWKAPRRKNKPADAKVLDKLTVFYRSHTWIHRGISGWFYFVPSLHGERAVEFLGGTLGRAAAQSSGDVFDVIKGAHLIHLSSINIFKMPHTLS